ncbi:MAG: 1-acyl-sn-glycerol-3-phosphate acyltransferase [Prolixibacteraceae bacterium]|jgi:putative hemolysin|nr:1-acyl-sn-glycerol-3-phosphate acyltransferase [Prolixibacteraceae bacterium]
MAGEQQNNNLEPIEIKELVRSKNPKLANRLPKFVLRWLEKLLHLKEINLFLEKYGNLKGLEFTEEAIKWLNIKFNIEGIENLPSEGRYMFVSNHPLGGLDGVLLLKILNERYGKTRVIINDFLMALTPLQQWFVPVNKVGGQARDSIKLVEELYESDDQVLIFPAGLCSRKTKGVIQDLEWQKHFIQKAVQHKLDIVPIHFGGRNSNRFYILANIRKFLRIKFNIEMMFLVDEMIKHRNKTFGIRFGKPIPFTILDKTKKPIEWAQYIKEQTYKLAKN